MTQIFNFRRFGRFLCWDFVQNIRSYTRLTGGLSIALCILSAIAVLYFYEDLRAAQDYYLTEHMVTLGGGCLSVVLLIHVVWASYTFAPQKTKQRYINFMMQPSTTLEKYVGRLLSIGIVSLLSGVIAVVVADLLHAVLCLVFVHRPIGSITLYFFDAASDLLDGRSSSPALIMFCVGAWLYLYSTYVLGSALFNRSPMLWTTLVDFAIWIVIVPAVLLINTPYLLDAILDSVDIPGAMNAVVWTLFVLNHVLAYLIFKRRQVICHGLISI